MSEFQCKGCLRYKNERSRSTTPGCEKVCTVCAERIKKETDPNYRNRHRRTRAGELRHRERAIAKYYSTGDLRWLPKE